VRELKVCLKVVFGCRRSIRELRGWEVVDVERREIEGKRRKGGVFIVGWKQEVIAIADPRG
jgi:hypothetical protein